MPPGVSRTHAKKRKISDESEERDSEEQLETSLVSGRQRRSAAMKTHKVWDQLKPGVKPHLEEEHEADEKPSVNTSAKRQRLTPKRGQKNADVKPEEHNVTAVKTATPIVLETRSPTNVEKRKINIETQQPGGVHNILSKKVLSTTKAAFQHPQQQAMSQEQLDLIEREMEKHNEIDEHRDESITDEDEEFDDEQNFQESRVLLDDPNDEDYMDFPSIQARRGRGADANFATMGRGGRARGGGGVRGGGVIVNPITRGDIKRGRPRGSRNGGGVVPTNGIMRGRINLRQPMNYYPSSNQSRQLSNGIYSLQPSGGIVGELSATRPTGAPVVRILRPAGIPLHSLRPASINVNLNNQQQITETNFTVNRELENYRNRIVTGSSVQEFNDAIDHLLSEYQRVVEDRSRLIISHREYVNHLKSTHQAAQDIKDNKIRHLEQTVEQLQQKLMSNFKNDQLRVVKQNCTSSDAKDEQKQSDVTVAQPLKQEDEQQINEQSGEAVLSSNPAVGQLHDEGSMAVGKGAQQQQQDPSEGGSNRHLWPPSQGQRIRIIGMSGVAGAGGTAMPTRLLQTHNPRMSANSPYFNDDMDDDDEEFEDEADSAEMDEELGAQVTI